MMMKAMRCVEYGPPEVLKEVRLEIPKPGPYEVLIKVEASSVTAAAILLRRGKHLHKRWMTFVLRLIYGWKKPKRTIPGFEFAGTVQTVGTEVKAFREGDRVYGTTTGWKQGAYAEYLCLPAQRKSGVLRPLPSNISMEQGAVLPVGAMTALYLLRKAGNLSGRTVLVIGATGSVGSYAVQLAHCLGAAQVKGACNIDKLEAFTAWGIAPAVSRQDLETGRHAEKYDVVFDASGFWNKNQILPFLKTTGVFITVNRITHESEELLEVAEHYLLQGKIKPFIDRTFHLEELVAAHHYAESGNKTGNIAIVMK